MPELMARFLHIANVALSMTGWLGTAVIITSVKLFGRIPLHQLPGVFQSVFIPPVQTPAPAQEELAKTDTVPVALLNQVPFLLAAEEEVPPQEPAILPAPPRFKNCALEV